MDIKQLHYFAAIVKNDFNLSQACKELYVSQPTLSVFINDFEKREQVRLFKRKNGRLTGLTNKGHQYYLDALEVLEKYDLMRERLHTHNEEISGTIKIGIPQGVNTALFSKALPQAILDNRKIDFQIFEEGAYSLSRKLLSTDIDIAVLLHPEPISSDFIEVYTILQSELAVAVSLNHKLASKSIIEWEDLHMENMAGLDDNFMITHLLKKYSAFYKINPNVLFESSSWDYLVEAVAANDDLFTLLPYPLLQLLEGKDIKVLKIKNPMPWVVTLCRLRKNNYTKLENYILEYFVQYFRNHSPNT